jgi:hypothetical protein
MFILCVGPVSGRGFRIDTIISGQTNSFATCEDRTWLSYHTSRRETLIDCVELIVDRG